MLNDHNAHKVLSDFFSGGTNLTYTRGQIVIRPEDDPSGIFFIAQGYVKTYGITKYGNEHLMLIRKSGEIFPMIWAFQGEHREVYYEAVTDVVLRRVSRSQFESKVEENVQFTQALLAQAIEMYRIHSERLYNLQFSSSREKVAYRLLTLAKRFGKGYSLGPGRVIIEVPVTHADIANSIGITRETTSRILKKFQKQGLIDYEKPHVVLTDIDLIRKIVY